MANPGGVGTKFVPVNLNKSYGPVSQRSYGSSSSYGQVAASRVRPGSHGSGGGGGGGGMVVLSRPRSSQKAGPKLSVPPPLNLPSLRKEHERFDLSGSGGASAGPGGPGTGSRPTSSGLGWTKPGTVALQEKDGGAARSGGDIQAVDGDRYVVDAATKAGTAYMPPSARLGGVVLPVPAPAPSAEKAAVLRGEDFPSLQAALPSGVPGPVQKQKDSSNKKKKQVSGEESSTHQIDSSPLGPLVHKPLQGQSLHHTFEIGLKEDGGDRQGLSSSQKAEQVPKQDYFPSPLPLVQLNPRSDWADDERDTGFGFVDRGRDKGYSKSEPYWDREFDMPRTGVLPHKAAHNLFERWGKRGDEIGKVSSIDIPKGDLSRRDIRTPSRENREGNLRTTAPPPKDGFNMQEVVNDINGAGARSMGLHREMGRDNKYIPPHFGDNVHIGVAENREFAFGRRDAGHGQEGRHQWNHMGASSVSRGTERNTRDLYVSEQHSRYRADAPPNSSMSKPSFSSGRKGLPVNDPILNFGREKRVFSKNERPYLDDPFPKDFGATSFDEGDPFSGGLVGVIKRKKDVVKQADFHDPVRESFEAELERVQKMQEVERQRIIEEQERALEQARREEEERQRLIREEEECRRRLEEEAREAAWRAEQERLEAIQRAEEQKIAREEEKQRILLEEERRKQAAKQKLLELEARIAKRQAEAGKSDDFAVVTDEKVSARVIEKDVSRVPALDNWEDGERMLERITTSGSSDSSGLNRSFELGSQTQSYRDGSSGFMDRGKSANSWRRDAFESSNSPSFLVQDQDNGRHNPKRDVSIGVRGGFPRKEFYEGPGYTSSRVYYRGGFQETHLEDFTHLKGHRASGAGDPYCRNTEIDPEFNENYAEKYGDVGWGQGHSRGNPLSPYTDRMYSESDELYSYGRLRHSMRQPRVLPPPSLASIHKTPIRGENDLPGPSTFLENDTDYSQASRSETTMQTVYYGGELDKFEASQIVDIEAQSTMTQEQTLDEDTTLRCDSQSSLSVSSPPNSPTHLSHDDLDDSGDSPAVSAMTEGKEISFSGNESIILNAHSINESVAVASNLMSAADEEDWALENNEEFQEQEEYDEDEDGYQEEEEVHEGDAENIDLSQEFEDLCLEEKGSSHVDNLVLGFDEGVEVQIPNDEFERNSRNEEGTLGTPEVSVSIIEEQQPVTGMGGDGHCLQHLDVSPQTCTDGSLRTIQEANMAVEDSVSKPMGTAPHTSLTSNPLITVDKPSISGLHPLHAVPSSVNSVSYSSSGQSVMSTGQADLPVKLQFGLFSGPSLIPSPVPAIQIGSIQMPLHLHPSDGPSLAHIHSSQPPLFQFGQLRYTSPISQGILPMASQSVSFLQPNVQGNFNLNQSLGGPVSIQPNRDGSVHKLMKDDMVSTSVSKENAESRTILQTSRAEISDAGDQLISEQDTDAGNRGTHDTVVKNYKPTSNGKVSEQLHTGPTSHSVLSDRDSRGLKAQGPQSSNKGKKFANSARNSSLRSSLLVSEASRSDTSGFHRRSRWATQRTELRVREKVDRRQSPGLVSSNNLGQDDKSDYVGNDMGVYVKVGSKKEIVANKPLKQMVESESSSQDPASSQWTDSSSKADKKFEKETSTKTQSITRSGEGNLKRTICSEEDVDAPLQSGIVRVFKQPGIETPSDEDDFIEVRSKRQMLNDRREQREKEIKAKSRVAKAPRKPRSTVQNAVVSAGSNKISTSLGGESANNVRSNFVASEGQGLANTEASTSSTTVVSQPLAPIGTPAVNSDLQADKRHHNIKSIQAGLNPVISNSGKNIGPDLMFETKNKVLDNVQTSLGSWSHAQIDQQVMPLTQSQLDEAMKPGRFDTHVASIGDRSSSVAEPIITTSSLLTKDKSFSSAASPINSLLAGEKIQFGAVTSPTVLPPGSRAISHGIGAPGSSRSDIQISHSFSAAENDCTIFFEKDKHQSETCAHLEDCEAEAEAEAAAAASAVAVAAISSDEIVGNRLSTCAVSVSDTKSFGSADIDGITAGDQRSTSQSRAEESLSVALPADLSVETMPISLWPPLPSPQNSSSPMLSHFPGGAASHFPFYEMNPMLGGPIFTFGPHNESGGTQSQSQKSTASGSGPLGTWKTCQSGMDSFYGPPTGFSGPFLSPPGGIPGVQGPPHMVVYNHFPVGQFGQVGLSFMSTTYVPSGKQPDWKHNPTSSAAAAAGSGEGDMTGTNMVSTQRNPPNMTAPVPLAPGSQLLPMASPLAMFDMSPFQSAPDMSVQGRWSHVPASPLHSVPLSMPLQHQDAGVLPPQFTHGRPMEQALTPNRFSESRISTPSDSSRNFHVATDMTATQFPDQLGLGDSSTSTVAGASAQSAVKQTSSGGTIADIAKTDAAQNGSSNSNNGQNANAFKARSSQQRNLSSHQYSHSAGYNYQRGGMTQKNSSGGDWLHRRMGFHGRNQSLGAEKGYSSSKVKQIYVAKQSTSGTSTVG
ncbi:uncharacterized protein LOC127803195 [Diospyros lotus]|uniref:uncharacterized protein LOC127803195 n=1 Tax=Diospyros lotus TaxID=55363 RepID=UPI00225A5265|nr:uncharacterized protein LOC127803195 [Diospyros lotus]